MTSRTLRLGAALTAAVATAALVLPTAALAKQKVRAFTFGGDVRQTTAPGGGSVTTFGGDVHIRSVGGPLRALTFGGDVDLDTLTSSARITTFGGQVHVYVGPGTMVRKPLTIRTYGGDVRLEIAPDVEASIEIEQVCRKGETCRVTSDVALEESVGPWKYRLFRGHRRTVRSTATIGDGGDLRVRVKVEGGDVSLIRAAVVAHR